MTTPSYPTDGHTDHRGKPIPVQGITAEQAGLEVGQRFVADNLQAAPARSDDLEVSPAAEPDYPHGQGSVTIVRIGETFSGWEAVFFRFDDDDEVIELAPYYFLLDFSPE